MTVRVLHVVPSFYPATEFGGPIISTKAICDSVSEHSDFSLRVLSTDAASPKNSSTLNLESRSVTFQSRYEVYYSRKLLLSSVSFEFLLKLFPLVRWADVVHLTAVYSFPTLPTAMICRVFNTPIVWSPRGALLASAEWENAPKKRAKRVFEHLASIIFGKNTVMHLTSDAERVASSALIKGFTSVVIPNSVAKSPEFSNKKWRPAGKLRILYLSRIHEKKGIEILIESLSFLPDFVSLDIYGDGNDDYIFRLKILCENIGVAERVMFHGHVVDEHKSKAFENADLFCLPTYSENFGIAIGEALASGLPVITTTRAPWAGICSRDCGRWIEPNVDELTNAILELMDVDLEAMGARGRAWIEEDFGEVVLGQSFASLYSSLKKHSTGQE